MRYRIQLSYCGADFCGWQKQPGAPSVQGTLETALYTLIGTPVTVVGAGRTDTEVNAVGYTAHFDAPGELDTVWICYKLNAILPASIAVSSVVRTEDDFHARFDAVRREYTYFLHRMKDPFLDGTSFCFTYAGLDFELMNKAAALLIGTHDFSCFQKSGSDNKTTICTVTEAAWHPYTPTHATLFQPSCHSERSEESSPYWYFRISADRFLRNMVRAIVGTLLEVGRGKRPLSASDAAPGCTIAPFDTLLDGGPRTASGESAPGHALFLSRIDYNR